jgi:hypothetical protein
MYTLRFRVQRCVDICKIIHTASIVFPLRSFVHRSIDFLPVSVVVPCVPCSAMHLYISNIYIYIYTVSMVLLRFLLVPCVSFSNAFIYLKVYTCTLYPCFFLSVCLFSSLLILHVSVVMPSISLFSDELMYFKYFDMYSTVSSVSSAFVCVGIHVLVLCITLLIDAFI